MCLLYIAGTAQDGKLLLARYGMVKESLTRYGMVMAKLSIDDSCLSTRTVGFIVANWNFSIKFNGPHQYLRLQFQQAVISSSNQIVSHHCHLFPVSERLLTRDWYRTPNPSFSSPVLGMRLAICAIPCY